MTSDPSDRQLVLMYKTPKLEWNVAHHYGQIAFHKLIFPINFQGDLSLPPPGERLRLRSLPMGVFYRSVQFGYSIREECRYFQEGRGRGVANVQTSQRRSSRFCPVFVYPPLWRLK